MIDDELNRFNDEYQWWSSFGKKNEEHSSYSYTEHQYFSNVQEKTFVGQKVLPYVCSDVDKVACHEDQDVVLGRIADASKAKSGKHAK